MSQVGAVHSAAASVRAWAAAGEATTGRLPLFSQLLFASCVCGACSQEEAGGRQRSTLLLLALATIATGPVLGSIQLLDQNLTQLCFRRLGGGAAAAARRHRAAAARVHGPLRPRRLHHQEAGLLRHHHAR